ncbi:MULTISPECIES: glycoside hydrolase family 2 TIM barrel-domain containing protein [unclassified Pedobacter]|uniref:glycoside hydrolase family 2 TIM barrel-domain containing protein n=1 Tax=unclassified Pedobacter TaxID=2628915 RepID=UPI001E3D29A9|nr:MULTISPECIES: glycoside hydrolase family 2 TIM barrel-domain containing protein [unclassified Pedobacter]
MLSKNLSQILSILLLFSVYSCTDKKIANSKISIQEINGKFNLLKNGKVFNIKGASGYTNLEELKKSGGNSIRIWDTTHVDKILNEANKHGISVIVGLPIPPSKYLDYYNNEAKVEADFKKIEALVNRLKTNPAVLMWCVGNELVFPNKPNYYHFYKSFNRIVDMIHKDDPDHPVTTTMVNFQKNDIVNIKLRTNIDIISFNIFSRISELKDDLKNFSWFWDGPYLITEWSIDGPWDGHVETAWKAKIEPTSTSKAKAYIDRYQKYMPTNDPRFLGSFIFYWGQKQEITHTWFSLFDEFGNKTEAAYAVEELWKGKKLAYTGPKITDINLSDKKAISNILLKPQEAQNARINVPGDTSNLEIKWEIYPEDWFKKNNVDNVVRPSKIGGLIIRQSGFSVRFNAPGIEGPYRLFATVFDKQGNIATANIPFYVVGNEK